MDHDFVGGHELDSPNARRLANLVIGFTALVLLSLATCVQFFNMQRDELIRSRAASGSYLLNEYRGQQDKLRSEAGKSEFSKPNPDGTMKIETVSFVPLADARAASRLPAEVISRRGGARPVAPGGRDDHGRT